MNAACTWCSRCCHGCAVLTRCPARLLSEASFCMMHLLQASPLPGLLSVLHNAWARSAFLSRMLGTSLSSFSPNPTSPIGARAGKGPASAPCCQPAIGGGLQASFLNRCRVRCMYGLRHLLPSRCLDQALVGVQQTPAACRQLPWGIGFQVLVCATCPASPHPSPHPLLGRCASFHPVLRLGWAVRPGMHGNVCL